MKLTVLGNSGGFPAAGGATSGYLLEIEGHYTY
jgi:ribonuclease BN (tRNA processing enzyme)